MKSENKILVISFIVLLTTSITLMGQQILENENNTEEHFSEFIERFKIDTQFQLERTVFPLKAKYFQDFDLEPLDTTISKENYYHQQLTFKENCSYKILKKNQKGESNNKFRTYEILGKDNGICVDYTFELIDSKWFLIQVNDMST